MGSAAIPERGASGFIYLRDLAAFAINAPAPATACVIPREGWVYLRPKPNHTSKNE
jgi:hypothetical protein